MHYLFMHDYYYTHRLPDAFSEFFTKVNKRHHYNTRLASKATFCLPSIRTNYGKFNLRFTGAKIWNGIKEEYKSLNRSSFKQKIKLDFLASY